MKPNGRLGLVHALQLLQLVHDGFVDGLAPCRQLLKALAQDGAELGGWVAENGTVKIVSSQNLKKRLEVGPRQKPVPVFDRVNGKQKGPHESNKTRENSSGEMYPFFWVKGRKKRRVQLFYMPQTQSDSATRSDWGD